MAVPALLLVASGAAALVFQVLWIKQLTLIVGVDVHAVTTGVSAFFGGLALGGLVLGRRADRTARPFRLYAALEFGVALTGVATTIALAHAAGPFARLEAKSELLAWSLLFPAVGVAPFLMGGTLPAIVRSLGLARGRIGAGGGGMYAANTLGAIVGALLTSFVLVPALGIRGTALAAAAVGLCAAAAGLWLDRRGPRLGASSGASSGASAHEPTPGSAPPAGAAALAILLYSVAGGLALGYEVVWSQSILPYLSTRSFAFSVMLATYLSGLALGSALYARWADRVRDPWTAFGLLIAAAGLIALLEMALLGPWLPVLQAGAEDAALALFASRLVGMCARFAVAALCIVFVPTLLLGAAFPAALRLVVDAGHVGRDVGRVVALNTLGGIVGTVLTGFVLVPRLGLVRTLGALAVAAAALGVVATLRSRRGRSAGRWATLAVAAAAVGTAAWTPPDGAARRLAELRGGELVFYAEGRGGTVAVLEQASPSHRFRRLYIQGVSNTGDAMPSLRYMRLQALLPLIVHPGEPESVLVIGLGTGITAGATLCFPGLERRVVAELLPEVVRAAETFEGNFDAPGDPRLDIRLRDGRRELAGSDDTYDVITLEPPPPSAAGVVNLYSSDFYALARTRLRPGGLFAQWLPIATQNDEDSRSLVRSFLDVFPHASLWTTELHEMLLIGSLEPLALDAGRIAARFSDAELAAALRAVGVASPAALLGTWITDRAGLAAYAGDGPPVTDDRPRIEHADWVRSGELLRVLPRLLELRTDAPLRNADAALVAEVAAQREILLTFYSASLNAMAGLRDEWARDLRRVADADGDNAYYRWFGSAGR